MAWTSLQELNRELQDQGVDPKMSYFIGGLFEYQQHVVQQLEEVTRLIQELANSLEGVVELHQVTQERVAMIGKKAGVDVRSESVVEKPEPN